MEPGFSVWLEGGGQYLVGEKEARILAGIRKYGSLMATAKSLGITYAHAWNVLNALASNAGRPVVMAKRGGGEHGGTELTRDGEKLLEEYERLQKKVSLFLGTPKEVIFGDFVPPDLSIIGSSCIGVKVIIGMLKGIKAEYVEIGSTAGLAALMLGEADIAGIHLFDEKTGTYNINSVRRLWLNGQACLIKGYIREQGIMTKKGNPRGIRDIKDIEAKKARLVNRNLGSGTRELLDRLLSQSGIIADQIRGYEYEVRTHKDISKAIIEGRADVGIGLRATAERYGLEFIKICDEEYDFVCDKRRLNKPSVRAFIEALCSEQFKNEVGARTSGINTSDQTGMVLEVRALRP